MLHACKCSAESARYSAIVSIDDRIFFAQPRLLYQCEGVLLIDRCRVRSRAMAARYRKALEPPGVGPDLARSERIYRTPETNVTMNCVPLRLVACRRRFRASYAPALWTLMIGRSSAKATSDLRSWKGTQI